MSLVLLHIGVFLYKSFLVSLLHIEVFLYKSFLVSLLHIEVFLYKSFLVSLLHIKIILFYVAWTIYIFGVEISSQTLFFKGALSAKIVNFCYP
jgi:hypothetical protein